MTLPRCYFSGLHDDSDSFCLLLEDIESGEVGDQIAGWSLPQVELAVAELARFHAAWWDAPRLEQFEWMPMWNDGMLGGGSAPPLTVIDWQLCAFR